MHQQTGGLDLRGGIGQHPLDSLEVGYGLSESLAILRILECLVVGSLGQAKCQRPNAYPAAIQSRQCLRQALPFDSEQVLARDTYLIKSHGMRWRTMKAHLLFRWANRDARSVGWNQDMTERVCIGSAEHNHQVGNRGIGHPHLCAIDDP